jgi:hypothetical protein
MTQDAPSLAQPVLSGDGDRASWPASATDDRRLCAAAVIGKEQLTNRDIRDLELERARHALAYLKCKLGNDGMRRLLENDLQAMTAKVRGWVKASAGAWQSGSVKLIVPGPSARAFQEWYISAMAEGREAELRAGHPEHFVSHPLPGTVEVVENIGETELPWRVFYRALPENADFPMAGDPSYALRYGMEILDSDGLRVGYSMRQSRDAEDGLHLQFTTHLPKAAPSELVRRHLNHFAIEFRNWTRAAWLASTKDSWRAHSTGRQGAGAP